MGGALPAMPFLNDKSGKTEQGDTLKILKMLAQAYKPELLGKSEDDNMQLEMMGNYCKQLNTALTEYAYGK